MQALADELPAFRTGLWEFNRTLERAGGGAKATVSSRQCVDPSADMKRQDDMVAKAGCKFSPVSKTGHTYTLSAVCRMQAMPVKSKTVMTVDSDSAYRLSIESNEDGNVGREHLVVRRVADC